VRISRSWLGVVALSLIIPTAPTWASSSPPEEAKPLSNDDVIALVKAGLGTEVIKAKISSSPAQFDTSAEGLAKLKAAGVPDEIMVAMLGAGPGAPRPRGGRVVDQLSSDYRRLQNAVVTVWSELGHGTGFIVDARGLILTNQHVVGPSSYVAVQFDPTHKIPARLLEADPIKDVAVLWADVTVFPDAIVAKISAASPPVEEGEKVFTIGSPMSQRKILTSGIASKVEDRAIISDININPGNSGGPLFNSLGEVVGLTTFAEQRQAGPGISGVVRIEEAAPLLDKARASMPGGHPPEPVSLPVEPSTHFPLDAIKTASNSSKQPDWSAYVFGIHNYDIGIITPPMLFHQSEDERRAAESHKKRSKEANDQAFNPTADLHNWAEYAGAYEAVVTVRATPKLRETLGSSLFRGLAAAGGSAYTGAATMKFKSDFKRMELLCGSKLMTPIQPGRIPHLINVKNAFVKATDATYEGMYSYPSEAFAPECGQVTLKVYPEGEPEPIVSVLDRKTVDRVWADFEAWRRAQ
jgi:S1-C subfamily serine protease